MKSPEWEKMTNAQKRKAIANDCLERFESKQLDPSSGTWLVFNIPQEMKANVADVKKLAASKVPCEACALGAVMCALGAFENHMKAYEGYVQLGDESVKGTHHDRLIEIFGKRQIGLIECAFEGGFGAYDQDNMSEKDYDKAVSFHNSFDTTNSLFRAIFTKITLHPQGYFLP